jgi:hypothetical protein
MRTAPLLRPVLAALCLGAVLVAAPACKKASSEVTVEAPAPEAVVDIPEAIIEENENGSVAWSVAPEGQVKAIVKSTDGKPITKNITGELLWKGPKGDEKIPVTVEEKTGFLIATGPRLDDDLTEIGYNLQVDSKPWGGTLHVPRGGTLELQESAKVSVAVPEGKVGPNGGVIQFIGEDRVEVVADKGGSGQVRVYFLDPEFKVIKGPDRKVKIAIVGDSPEVVILEPEPAGGLFFVGRLRTKVDPVRVTVAVTNRTVTHAAIVGWAPRTRLVVGARAPRVRLMVASGWDPDIDVRVRARGPTVVVHDDDDDRGRVRVKVTGRGHDHRDHDHGRVKVGGGAHVGVGVGVHVAVPRPPPPPSLHVGVGVGVHAGAGVKAGAGARAGGGVHVKGKGKGKGRHDD